MASPLRFTLVSDGPTDRALLPILNWILNRTSELAGRGIDPQWADLRGREKEGGLKGKVMAALRDYPCDLLFGHRDAEASERKISRQRRAEIATAMDGLAIPYVPVVPVRMTEAWLLIDVDSIREAADNPGSKARVELPAVRRLPELSDPKALLHELLVSASELSGRRRDRFRTELSWRRVRVAELIADFSPLERLEAFADLVKDTHEAMRQIPAAED